MKAVGAQTVDADVTGPPFATALRGVQEIVWNGIVMTHGGNINTNQMHQFAQFLPPTMIFAGSPYVATASSRASAMRKRCFWPNCVGVGVEAPDQPQVLAWDPMLISIDALHHLGTDATVTEVNKYILHLHDFAYRYFA